MASNLPKAGYNLIVHDIDSAKVQKAATEWPNTTASNGRPEAFANCDIIITMLPQGKIVREVLLGKENLARDLKKGTIVIDTSSSSPFDTIALGKELESLGLELIDSPITQTYMHATDAGESTLICGCDSLEVFERAEPVIRTMAGYVFHMGKLGNGHVMKTFNNYIMASSICALNDSLIAGSQLGLEPEKMIDVLNVGTGVCFPTLDTWRRDALTGRFRSGFGLGMLVKDLRITGEVMDSVGFSTELPELVGRYLGDAAGMVDAGADHTESLRGWEKRGGVQVKKTEEVKDIPREDFEHRLKGLNRSRNI